MKKILIVFLSSVLFFLTACGDSEKTSIDRAFGVEFGSDIEAVKKELSKIGEYEDDGFMLETNYIYEPNPYFSEYTIFYSGKIFAVSARTNYDLNDNQSSELFSKLEKELTNKYGNSIENIDVQKLNDDSDSIKMVKGVRWLVGDDSIKLSLNRFAGEKNKNYIRIDYDSKKTIDAIEQEHLKKEEAGKENKEKSISKGL